MTSLGGTEIADPAVIKGDIDVYPEYTGTAYSVVLKKTDVPDAAAAYDTIKTEYAARGLTTLAPSPYSNDNRVACTQEAVDQYGLKTLSDLGKASSNITYSANPEHLTRSDGLPLLKRVYGVNFKDVKSVALNLRYKPIEDGQAQCVYAFGTDPKIASLGLVLLEDDKGEFAGLAYENFPVINTAFFDAQPPVFAETLDKVDAAPDSGGHHDRELLRGHRQGGPRGRRPGIPRGERIAHPVGPRRAGAVEAAPALGGAEVKKLYPRSD